jgi:hypothetical protein
MSFTVKLFLRDSMAVDLFIEEKSSGTNLSQFLDKVTSDTLTEFFLVILVNQEDIMKENCDVHIDMHVQVGETCCVQIKRHGSMQRHLLPESVQDDLGKFMNSLVHLSFEMMLNK